MTTTNLVKLVKNVRERTGAGVLEVKEALKEMDWNEDAAVDMITTNRKSRPRKEIGYTAVFTYNHNNRIAAIIELGCNTDFVGKTEEFLQLGQDLVQQVVGTAPRSVDELLGQEFVRDGKVKIKDMLADLSRKTQEDVEVVQFHRIAT